MTKKPLLALALSGLAVVVYGNAIAFLAGFDGPLREAGEFAPFVLVALALFWARLARLTLYDLGLRVAGWPRGLAWGVLAGLAMAAPALGFFAFPLIMMEPVVYSGYQRIELGALATLLLIRLPLRTALAEELVFRGVLQARAVQLLGVRGGILCTCTLFVLWHAVITYQTIGLTNLKASPLPASMLWVLSAVPLAAAGLILSWLRLKTNGLAAPFAAHWVVNSCIALFLTVSG